MNGLVASGLIALKLSRILAFGPRAEHCEQRAGNVKIQLQGRDLVPEAESLVFNKEVNKEINGF